MITDSYSFSFSLSPSLSYTYTKDERERTVRKTLKPMYIRAKRKDLEVPDCNFSLLVPTVIQVYAPTSNAEEAEIERFYEDLQDLLELTPKKDVLFIIGDWDAKVGSQETPGLTGKFGLGVRNEAGQRLIEFCQENALVITNTLF